MKKLYKRKWQKDIRKKKRMTLFGHVVRSLVFIACGVLSAFLLMSGYESIYNRDLPLTHTLDTVTMTAFTDRYDLRAATAPTPDMYGNFGKPQVLKLPENIMRLDIVAPIVDSKQNWLARANTMHLLIVQPPRRGNIGLVILYCRSSFRTIAAEETPSLGSNLFIDTDKNWRYVYKVTATKLELADQPHIVNDDGKTGKLVVTCYDSHNKTNLIIEAALISVQGVTQ